MIKSKDIVKLKQASISIILLFFFIFDKIEIRKGVYYVMMKKAYQILFQK